MSSQSIERHRRRILNGEIQSNRNYYYSHPMKIDEKSKQMRECGTNSHTHTYTFHFVAPVICGKTNMAKWNNMLKKGESRTVPFNHNVYSRSSWPDGGENDKWQRHPNSNQLQTISECKCSMVQSYRRQTTDTYVQLTNRIAPHRLSMKRWIIKMKRFPFPNTNDYGLMIVL